MSFLKSAKRMVRSVLDRIDVWRHDKEYAQRFSETYNQKKWGAGLETVSGEGSTMERTATVRKELPGLLRELNVRSMIDAPCGDYYWMKEIALPVESYQGFDLVPEIIEKNKQQYEKAPAVTFAVKDLIIDPLPKADLIMIRDCFIHLSLGHIKKILRNVVDSGTTWLLCSHSVQETSNRDISSGPGCRGVNMTLAPLHLPEPRRVIVEEIKNEKPYYVLGLWHRDEVAAAIS